MTPYHTQHADLFRAVAEILVRDYIAPSETAETVAEWCEFYSAQVHLCTPEIIAEVIAEMEGYDKK